MSSPGGAVLVAGGAGGPTPACPVCSLPLAPLTGPRRRETADRPYMKCPACGYMASYEKPGAGAEVAAVDPVRERNFQVICRLLKRDFPRVRTILDVGCSRGLFLASAGRHGFAVTGIEPDAALAEEARARGFPVIHGFFPGAEALGAARYDAIIFNDSFEHIPDLGAVLDGVKKHLAPDGVVMVNLPSSEGLMFGLARVLYNAGIAGPFDRLWQKGFASPHLHYFNRRNLRSLFARHGFAEAIHAKLRFYVLKGLWTRIICKSSVFAALAAYPALALLYPLFSVWSDCGVSFFTEAKK